MKSIKENKYFKIFYKYSGIKFLYIKIRNFIFFGFIQNCGGRNTDITAFAGNLLKDGLTDEEIFKIYHNLIMKNGTRKETNASRNQGAIDKIIDLLSANPNKKEYSVLDIGSSNGIDGYNNCRNLQTKVHVGKYVLGDLYTEILFDKKRKLIFDQDVNLIQVLKKNYFVNINFQFTYGYQRFTNLFKRILPFILKKRLKLYDADVHRIPLVHPVIHQELQNDQLFQIQRLDVCKPIPGRYDIIICFHLLTDLYFNETEIKRYKSNLVSVLNPGGLLITGTSTKYQIIEA